MKLKETIKMNLEQYECPGCKRKFYVNEEDIIEFNDREMIDCPFCDIAGVPNTRLFKIEVHEIFEK